MTSNVTRYAARGARWSALRPNAANYGMPNLELQLGNVRPPLGTRPCAQRSEHAAVARVVDELRAGGSGSKGQHRDSREATLKRGCKWSAEGGTNTRVPVQRCAQELGCSAALTFSSIASRARGRPSKQLSEVSKPMSRSAHELTWLARGSSLQRTGSVAASAARGGSLFYPWGGSL